MEATGPEIRMDCNAFQAIHGANTQEVTPVRRKKDNGAICFNHHMLQGIPGFLKQQIKRMH